MLSETEARYFKSCCCLSRQTPRLGQSMLRRQGYKFEAQPNGEQLRNLRSQEKHGKNVKQKAGLNRAVLDASPFELRRQLQYKLTWRGGLLVAVRKTLAVGVLSAVRFLRTIAGRKRSSRASSAASQPTLIS